MVQYVFNREFR